MKHFPQLLLALFILAPVCFTAFAQDKNSAADLISQGELLHTQGKYDEAIAKFNEVLKTDPENAIANYELAYVLYASKRAAAAIPYLQKVVMSNHAGLVVAAYSLLGSIYDGDHQPQKAVEAFNQGIKLDANYPQVYYNLGLAYFRNMQYAEAEAAAIEAIKHDPKNAGNQRLYALVTFHQNKRANALLGFCSFILLEPNTQRSTEAYNNIQSILKGGVLRDNSGKAAVPAPSASDKETGELNAIISGISLSAQNKRLTGINLLTYELKNIFEQTGQAVEKKSEKTFFDNFFAVYLYKLAQSQNMTAFANRVASTVNKDEQAKWADDNKQQINDLNDWITKTERGY